MTAQNGTLVLIKIGNGGAPESFSTVGGLRICAMVLNNQPLDASNLDTGAWRALQLNAGLRALRISGSGLFTDSSAEELMRGHAFAGTLKNYRFIFANGDYLNGAFLLAQYERGGAYGEEELYTLSLESAGSITFNNA